MMSVHMHGSFDLHKVVNSQMNSNAALIHDYGTLKIMTVSCAQSVTIAGYENAQCTTRAFSFAILI
jgi:hypothetical protein